MRRIARVATGWADVTGAYCHARCHDILLRRGFDDRPVELYCTPENLPSIQM